MFHTFAKIIINLQNSQKARTIKKQQNPPTHTVHDKLYESQKKRHINHKFNNKHSLTKEKHTFYKIQSTLK